VAENQLTSINDGGTQNITGTFTYDANGNMLTDSKKNITITYNYLDLPDTVKQGSSKLVFSYDAAGNKLYKQLITSGTVVSQKHYIEDAEVTATTSLAYDGKIESIAMDEGRIVNTPSGYKYEYQLQDHLGNNRVRFRAKSDGTADLTQVQNYYPFGGDMGDTTMNYTTAPNNLYKYSGKELQTELNLDSYDFGARHYDPRLGRWMTMDPLGMESDELSPYNYVENNPMNMIDPNGMQPASDYAGTGFVRGIAGRSGNGTCKL
jgi:RHS repeat-associated protein